MKPREILAGILWGLGLFVLYAAICWELGRLTPFIYAGRSAMHRWFGLMPLPLEDAQPAP